MYVHRRGSAHITSVSTNQRIALHLGDAFCLIGPTRPNSPVQFRYGFKVCCDCHTCSYKAATPPEVETSTVLVPPHSDRARQTHINGYNDDETMEIPKGVKIKQTPAAVVPASNGVDADVKMVAAAGRKRKQSTVRGALPTVHPKRPKRDLHAEPVRLFIEPSTIGT